MIILHTLIAWRGWGLYAGLQLEGTGLVQGVPDNLPRSRCTHVPENDEN